MWERPPGRSLTRPPRTSTTECSCRLWPSPMMYAFTSCPFVRRTRAIFRRAEFGFFGVMVVTLIHTPRLNGVPFGRGTLRILRAFHVYWSAGDLLFLRLVLRGFLMSWLMVGIENPPKWDMMVLAERSGSKEFFWIFDSETEGQEESEDEITPPLFFVSQ